MRGSRALPWRPRLRILFILAAIHFGLTIGTSLRAFGMSMDRFDTGHPKTLAETTLENVAAVLRSPMEQWLEGSDLPQLLLPGLLGYLPFLLNSLLWAGAVWLLLCLGTLPSTILAACQLTDALQE